jgi:hypothetical protein
METIHIVFKMVLRSRTRTGATLRPNLLFILKPSLAPSPDLDMIQEHARTFSDDVGKVLFRLRKTLLLGPWDENASPHILTGTHKTKYC